MITLINHQGTRVMEGIQIQTPSPPIGLAYLAATLKKMNIEYCVIDACGEALDQVTPFPLRPDCFLQGLQTEEVIERVPAQTDIIGITCLFSQYWPVVRELAKALRAHFPGALMVLGGEHATAVPEHVLSSGHFDVCVLGEGEETFLRLIHAHRDARSFADIPGIAFLEDGQYRNNGLSPRTREIDDIPWPDWDSFPIDKYITARQVTGVHLGRSFPILGTRGCPYQCTFCSSPDMWTTRWIHRDPVDLVDEMNHFKNKYDLDGFAFMDLTFVINGKSTVRFAQELIDRNLNIVYQLPSGTRSEGFNEGVADLLYRSGLRNFAFAPESGSEEVLTLIKKQIDLTTLFQAIRVCLKTPMTLGCYIVIGFPEDTQKSLRETLKLVRKLARIGVHDITVSKFTPYPGSVHFKTLLSEGKIELNDSFFLSPLDFYTNKSLSYCDAVDHRGLYRWMIWMFCNFYVISFCLRPWSVIKHFVSFFTKGIEETRYMRWLADTLVTRRRWRKNLKKTMVTTLQAAEKP